MAHRSAGPYRTNRTLNPRMFSDQLLLFVLFNAGIILLLALDLGVLHRTAHTVGLREATVWSVIWVLVALVFNVAVYVMYESRWMGLGTDPPLSGRDAGLQFLTGYIIERALSMDNIFVFIVIFNYFGVPSRYQYKVLFWGIFGALVMRSIFIIAGTVLIAKFSWILYIFGVILIVSGWKMLRGGDTEVHPEKNLFIRLARKVFPVETGYDSPRFFVRKHGRLHITTLFLVLLTVETTDVVFAVDSIPAVFAVTRDPFIVYSSNVFAILGLRALYFLLAGVMNTFVYLKYGLSLVLVFVGVKMLIVDLYHVSILASLLIITLVLGVSVLASVLRRRRGE